MQLRNTGMPLQHRRRVVIDERVDFEAARPQHGNDRRGEQHVAVVAQLDHERAPALGQGDGILEHPGSLLAVGKHALRISPMKLVTALLVLWAAAAQAAPAQRIVSLAPHLTELTFAAGAGAKLVAVSDYSDFPPQAARLPRVASATGIDI